MAVAYDNASTGTLAFGTTLTIPHLVSGSDRALFNAVVGRDQLVSGATYNSISLTEIISESPNAGGGFGDFWFGYMPAPATGSNDLVVTLAAADSAAGIVSSYTGVDQTTVWDGQQNDRGSDATATVTVTSATDNMVVGAIAASTFGPTTFTPGTGQTERGDLSDGGDEFLSVSLSDEAGASSVTHSYTLSGSANHTMTAVNVRASGGGAGGSALPIIMQYH